MTRSLYDCPNVPVGPAGVRCRVVVATHPAGKTKSRVGLTRQGVVYELFFTSLPQQSFTVIDVVELYLHRGAFEPALSDEDDELDPDRWCSHCACGQECWQLIAQWVWNEAPGVGSCAGPAAATHHRVCPCSPSGSSGADGSWLQRTCQRYLLESGPLHGLRLYPPTRWELALPGWQEPVVW